MGIAARPYAAVKAMELDQLVREHDEIATHTQLGLNFYRDEIARRHAEAETAKIVAMTRQMRNLTRAIRGLTIINVVLVAVGFFG